MSTSERLASAQLGRMRGMTAMYHRRFFRDVQVTLVLTLALFAIGWWGVPEAFLLVPVVALTGAIQTAFDSSYLVFARWYAAYLERYLNDVAGTQVLVAAELEDTYLFPLGDQKVVTIPVGGGFSWFSFVTVFYTLLGALAFGFGLALGWSTLAEGPRALMVLYLVGLGGLTIAALLTGVWWFVTGEGERRLERVLDARFGTPTASSGS